MRQPINGLRGDRRGFSLIELIVALVIGMFVLTGVVQMMIAQGRGYRKQREVIDIRETAREAAALLAWDLRQSFVGASPLAAMSASSVALRSPRGLGIVCAKHPTLARYALWKTGGNILAGADDSALVYQGDGDRYVVFASKGGAPVNPGWYHNLKAHPQTRIEVGTETVDVDASEASGEERERLFRTQVARVPQFGEYDRSSGRRIPVMVLTPRSPR